MRMISEAHLLELWERGAGLRPVERGLLLLGAAVAEAPADQLADWPLGRRNSALAEWRRSMFGSRLNGWAACPSCDERLEFDIDARALVASDPDADSPMVAFQGRTFRVPTTRDLAAVDPHADPSDAASLIVGRCCVDANGTETWSSEAIEAIGLRMASADALAETRIALQCPECGRDWDDDLDIVEFLWTEVEAVAKRLLRDVHVLASAYGWTEPDVLALGAARRSAYIAMVTQ